MSRRHLIFALVLVACKQADPPPPEVHPEPPLVPLPEVCKPWKPAPEKRVLTYDETPDIPGERKEFATCYKGGECFFPIDSNSSWFEGSALWTKDPEGHRSPYGASSKCDPPVSGEWVTCHTDVNNRSFDKIEDVTFKCRGQETCAGQDDCCRIVERKKVFVKHEEPSKDQLASWEKDRCDGLQKRLATCRPFCTDPRYSPECASYWQVTCETDRL